MALTVLFILFVIIIIVSVLGSAFLLLVKSPKLKSGLFYFLAIWSMLIAFLSATSLPTNYIFSQIISWAIGFIGIVAIPIKIKCPLPKGQKLANILVIISVILGMIKLVC
ncbi:MAG: hypothetical protein ACK5MV_02710 [Aminipila sp.]